VLGSGKSGHQRARWIIRMGIAALLAVAVVAGLPEIRDGMATARQAHVPLLGFAVLLEMAAMATLPQVYRASLEAMGGRLTYPHALQVSMGAFTLSRALPGGGPAGALFAARRMNTLGADGAAATAGAIGVGILNILTLSMIVTVGALLATTTGDAPRVFAAAAMTAAAVLGLALVVARQGLQSRAFRDRAFTVADPVLRRVGDPARSRQSVEDLAADPPRMRDLAAVMRWSALAWGLELAALWTVFLAFGAWMPVGILILGWGVANLINSVPHTPGGLGLVETGMTGAYVMLGTTAATAIIAVLAYRLVCYWVPMLAGIPMLRRTDGRPTSGERSPMQGQVGHQQRRVIAAPSPTQTGGTGSSPREGHETQPGARIDAGDLADCPQRCRVATEHVNKPEVERLGTGPQPAPGDFVGPFRRKAPAACHLPDEVLVHAVQ
jgi:uncharacterized membrane protein YbhN (UPF0104 family)